MITTPGYAGISIPKNVASKYADCAECHTIPHRNFRQGCHEYYRQEGKGCAGFTSENMPIAQNVIPYRIVISARDVMNITGRKERAARDLLQRIRENNGKGSKQFVTVSERFT